MYGTAVSSAGGVIYVTDLTESTSIAFSAALRARGGRRCNVRAIAAIRNHPRTLMSNCGPTDGLRAMMKFAASASTTPTQNIVSECCPHAMIILAHRAFQIAATAGGKSNQKRYASDKKLTTRSGPMVG